MTSSPFHPNRSQGRFQRLCLQILPIAVAAAFLWMARPQDGGTSSGHSAIAAMSQPASSAGLSQPATGDAILTSLPVSSPRLITRPIEDIRPGMRVLASNPEHSDDSQRLSFDDKLDWRLVKYRMAKPDGSWLNINQLESAADLTGLVPRMQVELSYPELAIEGPAEIVSIQACPAIESGAGEVVTATFHHTAANVIHLHIAGELAPIGTTSNHPFWSEDRFDWVQAGDLQSGEHLRLIDGTLTTVDVISRNPETQPVYNLTVNALHTYHIGESGVLVHNSNNYTRLGVTRNNPADWRATRDLWDSLGMGNILSSTNRSRIAAGRTPRVDADWIDWFPGDDINVGQKIPMHHIGGTPLTVPLPHPRHMDAHLPGGTRLNPGGPGVSG